MFFINSLIAALSITCTLISLYDFLKKKRSQKKNIIAIIFIVLITFIYYISNYLHYRNEINETKENVSEILSYDNPKSMEQLRDKLDKVEYEYLLTAVDELIQEKRIHEGKVDVTSIEGYSYRVTIYNNINFPIQ